MNIILFGPPGAGKGTQSNKIVHNFKLHKVSTGDLLRDEVKNRTELGRKIKPIVDKGLLVSDDVINNLMSKVFSNKKYYNQLIFDGYPRNLNQAKKLDTLVKKYNQKISCVISLNIEKEIVIKRILGRQTCSICGLIFNEYFNPASKENHLCDPKFLLKRSDDNEEIIRSRFETYIKQTLPIIDFYKQQNLLHQINGMGKIDQIFEEIRVIITSLET